MAAPAYYPLWATEDTTLPATNKANKEMPKGSLQTTGWDKGQIPSAEEMNWILNNIYLWVKHLNEEVLQAVVTPTPNSIVRRDSSGGVYASGLFSNPLLSTEESGVTMKDSSGKTCGTIASTQTEGASGYTHVSRITPSTQTAAAVVQMYDAGYVDVTSPRSTSKQEVVDNALIRYDTHSSAISTVNSSISSAVSTLNANIDQIRTTMVGSIRLGTRVSVTVGDFVEYGAGYVVTMGGDFGAADGYYYLRPLQYWINGTWYTATYT